MSIADLNRELRALVFGDPRYCADLEKKEIDGASHNGIVNVKIECEWDYHLDVAPMQVWVDPVNSQRHLVLSIQWNGKESKVLSASIGGFSRRTTLLEHWPRLMAYEFSLYMEGEPAELVDYWNGVIHGE